MRILLAPAKKMRVDIDSLAPHALPQFLPEAEQIKCALQGLSDEDLQSLWRCSTALAKQNIERLRAMDLQKSHTPALLAYEGIAYQYMAPNVFEDAQYAYVQKHLRILSGFYGLLRPFDAVVPYRLEMQAKLGPKGHKDLYAFWGNKLARQVAQETDFVLNLASKEYSRAVQPQLPPEVCFVTCSFVERTGDKLIEKGTPCKMARGQMVRWLAEHRITARADVRAFDALDYRFSAAHSTDTQDVFIKGVV